LLSYVSEVKSLFGVSKCNFPTGRIVSISLSLPSVNILLKVIFPVRTGYNNYIFLINFAKTSITTASSIPVLNKEHKIKNKINAIS
jgi:hypothetical protein